MDAPQLPGAESSAPAAGGQPPGQASAFRRALDAQIEPPDPGMALVPAGPHDLTRPIDVKALREALTGEISAPITITETPAPLPTVPVAPPSPNGPAVVVPTVSVPELRGPTTIATPTPKSVRAHGVSDGRDVASAPPPSGYGHEPAEQGSDHDHSPRHSGGSGKPSRLPTTIGICVLLAAVAATALVLIDGGRSSGPLAPSAMPTKSATTSQAAQRPVPAATSHRPSPSSAPSHSPSHSPSPSASATKPSGGASAVASFTTITWTNNYQPLVADIQSRLTKLRYLSLNHDTSQYALTERTMSSTGNRWWHPTDSVGFYQNATTSAIRAFKFDYLQHNQGQPSMDGSCDTATYQALVNATS
ncbi:MAG TPA: hypothetical protein VFU65_05625 [Actinocrinis sp.]|nr:hypothetical protein [Actinocrinis sp.]